MAVAAANAVALCPDGNEGLPGNGHERAELRIGDLTALAPVEGVLELSRSRPRWPVTRRGARRRGAARGRCRVRMPKPSPRTMSSGPLTHQAESTTKRTVRTGAWKDGAMSISRPIEVEEGTHERGNK